VNTANQQPARSSLISLFGQLLSLAIVVLLVKTTEGSLIKLAIAFCLSPLLVLIAANVFLYNGDYKKYRPQMSKVDFSYSKGLFNLGLTFFIIQFANILQFQSANIIIAQYFGVSEVTSYNIVYKYFGVLIMVFTIFLTPFWSASTEAFLKDDIRWIKNGIRKYNQLNVIMVVIGLIMLVSSGTVYRLWLGEGKVHIDFSLSLCGFLFFNTSVFGGKYVSFLNGISALRIQFWACIISPFLYILVTMLFIQYYHMGVYAIFIAAIIANFNTFILAPIQYYQIIIKNKRGIWIK
jgi:O-antigen/teichoic acid export membrane protein